MMKLKELELGLKNAIDRRDRKVERVYDPEIANKDFIRLAQSHLEALAKLNNIGKVGEELITKLDKEISATEKTTYSHHELLGERYGVKELLRRVGI